MLVDNQIGMTSENSKLEVQIGKLETKVDFVIGKLDDLEKGIVTRLERVEATKLAAQDFMIYKTDQAGANLDKETRIRFLEKYAWIAIGALGLIQLISFAYIAQRLQ